VASLWKVFCLSRTSSVSLSLSPPPSLSSELPLCLAFQVVESQEKINHIDPDKNVVVCRSSKEIETHFTVLEIRDMKVLFHAHTWYISPASTTEQKITHNNRVIRIIQQQILLQTCTNSQWLMTLRYLIMLY